jgi:hypothetical protein
VPARPSFVPRPRSALEASPTRCATRLLRSLVGAICCLLGSFALSVCWACTARAHEIAEELTIGGLSAGVLDTFYVIAQLEAVFALNDTWFIMTSAALTHLAPTATLRPADIPHYGLALGVTPSQNLEFELVAQLAPPSSVFDAAVAPAAYLVELQSQSFAALASATHTSDEQRDIAAKLEATVGVAYYSTQRTLFYDTAGVLPAAPTLSALSQYRAALTATTTFLGRTDLALSGSYYGYFQNFTTPDGQNIILASGLPLEPLRLAIRGSAAHKLGDFTFGAHIQRALYVSGLGGSWSAGAKVDLSVSDPLELSLSGEFQDALFTDGTTWNVFGVTLGASFAF